MVFSLDFRPVAHANGGLIGESAEDRTETPGTPPWLTHLG